MLKAVCIYLTLLSSLLFTVNLVLSTCQAQGVADPLRSPAIWSLHKTRISINAKRPKIDRPRCGAPSLFLSKRTASEEYSLPKWRFVHLNVWRLYLFLINLKDLSVSAFRTGSNPVRNWRRLSFRRFSRSDLGCWGGTLHASTGRLGSPGAAGAINWPLAQLA